MLDDDGEKAKMSILFEPMDINGMKVSNRFVRSATNDRCADTSGRVTDALVDIYKNLAAGGVGLIVTGHAYVTKNGKATPTMLGLYDDDLIPGLQRLVKAVHQYDSKIVIQINHAGRQTTSATIGETPSAPSAVYNPLTGETPRAFTGAEIESVIEAYGKAAERAVAAGFDAVQIHCAHGYLGSQFISPYTNQRKDRWGGSPENRMRFLLEVFDRIRLSAGDDYPVLIKLNSEDFIDGGLSLEESCGIAGVLSDKGIDAIEISGSMAESPMGAIRKNILKEEDEAYFLSGAREFKKVISVPLILVGGLRSPGLMEKVLEKKEADMIALCRPLIREPDIINKWMRGGRKKADCVSCGGCQKYPEEPVRCILLDETGGNG